MGLHTFQWPEGFGQSGHGHFPGVPIETAESLVVGVVGVVLSGSRSGIGEATFDDIDKVAVATAFLV